MNFFKKTKKIRTKLMVSILPIVIIAFIALAISVTLSAKSSIELEMESKIHSQLELTKESITSKMKQHQMLPIILAETVEASGITTESQASIIETVKMLPQKNSDTFGAGVFMGTQYNGSYFGPYAYKEGSKTTYTEDYFKDNTQEGWYKVGDTDLPVAWTSPFYDTVINITMMSAVAPIRDAKGTLISVATADLEMSNIQRIVSDIKVGKNGFAMLIAQDGSFISKGKEPVVADQTGQFPNITNESNATLANLGNLILKSKEGDGTFKDKGTEYVVRYSSIPETGWIVILSIPKAEIDMPINEIMKKVGIITGLALAVLCVLIIAISRNITKPLYPLAKDIQVIAQGDFTHNIDSNSEDEIGFMAKALNQMVASLRETISEIAVGTVTVATTAEELEASATQNGQAVEQVALSANEISSANSEIATVADSLQTNVMSVNKLSENIASQMHVVSKSIFEVNHLSEVSGKSVNALVDSMGLVFNDIEKMSHIMNSLTENSQQIDTIVDTIQGISSQTNLLALNASIEAARAGEAGRGFAVVAEEIRNLAEQSSNSANTISTIVSEVTRETRSANVSTNKVVESIRSSQAVLEQVGKAFNEIMTSLSGVTESVTSADQLSSEISSQCFVTTQSAIELTELTNQTAESASSIAAATEEQLASMEEQVSATTAMAHIAEELHEKVNHFKIGV